MKIPIIKPFIGEEKQAVCEVLDSGWLTSGSRCKQFEDMVAEYSGASHGIAVSSATSGLHLGLLALGIGKGDEVIVPSFTFPATANAVLHCGAKPVFCDVHTETYNIDVEDAESRITEYTRAIMPVHLFGSHADMDFVIGMAEANDLKVIEDAACSLGNGVLQGNIAVYSFHPRKIITTGEGGMIVTDDNLLATDMYAMRNHGSHPLGWEPGGYNFRLTDIQAAIGIEQMKKIDYIIEQRRQIACAYYLRLATVSSLTLPPKQDGHTYQSFVCVYSGDRDKLVDDLREREIETTKGTYAVHRIFGHDDIGFNHSAFLEDHTITLPLWVGMTPDEFSYVVENVKECCE